MVGTLDRDGFEMSLNMDGVYSNRKILYGQADENIQADQSNFNRQVTISAFIWMILKLQMMSTDNLCSTLKKIQTINI